MKEKGRDQITLETKVGVLDAFDGGSGMVTVDMGPVRTDWREIPLAEERDTLHLGFQVARQLTAEQRQARVADAVLLPIGVVGMSRAKQFGDLAVVLAASIDVADEQSDRRPSRLALEDAGENLHRIRLAPLTFRRSLAPDLSSRSAVR